MGCGAEETRSTDSHAAKKPRDNKLDKYIDMSHELATYSYKDHKIAQMNSKFNSLKIPMKLRVMSENCKGDEDDRIDPGDIKSARRLFYQDKYQMFEIFEPTAK